MKCAVFIMVLFILGSHLSAVRKLIEEAATSLTSQKYGIRGQGMIEIHVNTTVNTTASGILEQGLTEHAAAVGANATKAMCECTRKSIAYQVICASCSFACDPPPEKPELAELSCVKIDFPNEEKSKCAVRTDKEVVVCAYGDDDDEGSMESCECHGADVDCSDCGYECEAPDDDCEAYEGTCVASESRKTCMAAWYYNNPPQGNVNNECKCRGHEGIVPCDECNSQCMAPSHTDCIPIDGVCYAKGYEECTYVSTARIELGTAMRMQQLNDPKAQAKAKKMQENKKIKANRLAKKRD